MGIVRLVVAAVVAVAWIPLLIRFFRSWRDRENPISLAICFLIIMASYTPLWVAVGPENPWSWAGLLVIDSLVCGSFYAALLMARRRFKDDRRN
jgi:hypothetical protein